MADLERNEQRELIRFSIMYVWAVDPNNDEQAARTERMVEQVLDAYEESGG